MSSLISRAKNENGFWEYGAYFKHQRIMPSPIGHVEKADDYEHYIVKDSFADWNMPRRIELVKVYPNTVGSYTGKHDKKGNRIFAGDIFFIYGEYDNGLIIEDRSGYIYVDYNKDECAYMTRAFNGEWQDYLYEYLAEESEEDPQERIVVGNIIDNPELTKPGRK